MFKKNKKKSLSLNYRFTIVLAVVIAISVSMGIMISARTNTVVDQKIAETKESIRPADLEIISIVDSNCDDCFSLSPLIEGIKQMNVNITTEKTLQFSEQEANDLVVKFNIEKVPVLIIKGEIEKDKTLADYLGKIGKIEDNTFILTKVLAPYVATDTGEVKGLVELTMITDRDCKECYDVTVHEKILRNFGINTNNGQVTEIDFPDAQKLIKKYNITLVPTIIITGDVSDYPSLQKIWTKVGTIEEDGSYIFRQGVKQMGSYKDLSTGKVIKPAKK